MKMEKEIMASKGEQGAWSWFRNFVVVWVTVRFWKNSLFFTSA
jgi:hypothetical protein